MKTDEGMILEATIDELRELWWKDEYFKEMSFSTFIKKCREQGTKIIEVTNNE